MKYLILDSISSLWSSDSLMTVDLTCNKTIPGHIDFPLKADIKSTFLFFVFFFLQSLFVFIRFIAEINHFTRNGHFILPKFPDCKTPGPKSTKLDGSSCLISTKILTSNSSRAPLSDFSLHIARRSFNGAAVNGSRSAWDRHSFFSKAIPVVWSRTCFYGPAQSRS